MSKEALDWVILPLSSVISKIVSGVSVNAEDRQKKSGEIGVLKMSCITDGAFNPSEHKSVLQKEKSRAKCPVKSNTIIMGRKNTPYLVGSSAFCPSDVHDIYLSDLLWQIHVYPQHVNPKWFSYLLASPKIRKEIAATASGTSKSMKGITKEGVLSLSFLCPSLPEQHAIVEILDTADEAVRVAEALVEAKVAYKRALAEELLTEKAGQEWREYQLGELFTERNESDRADLKLLAVTGAEGVMSRDGLTKRDTSSEDKSKYLRVVPGDFVYNTMRMWQGVGGFSELEGIVSPAYTVCIPGRLIDGRFAAYLFKSPAQINLFFRHSQGLVKDTLNLKFHHFAQIRVRIPKIAEQRKIAACLMLVDEEIALLRRQCAALKRQKQGLMQKLLTGEVRVPGFGEASDGA